MFTDSVERPLRLRIALGYREKQPVRWEGGVEVSNGHLRSVRPWNFEVSDSFQSAGKWSFESAEAMKGLLVDLTAAAPSLPGSSGLHSGNDPRQGGRGGPHVHVQRGRPEARPDLRAGLPRLCQRRGAAGRLPSARGQRSRASAPRFQTSPSRATSARRGRFPRSIRGRRRAAVPSISAGAGFELAEVCVRIRGQRLHPQGQPKKTPWTSGTKAKGKELARLDWDGDRITWRIGTGATPYYREDRKASVSLAGRLPAGGDPALGERRPAATRRGVSPPCCEGRCRRTTPAATSRRLRSCCSASRRRTRGNVSPHRTRVAERPDGAETDRDEAAPGEDPARHGKQAWTEGRGPAPARRVRRRQSCRRRRQQCRTGPFHVRSAGRFHGSVTLKLPFVSDLSPAGAAELEQLDYEAQRGRVSAYWQEQVNAGAALLDARAEDRPADEGAALAHRHGRYEGPGERPLHGPGGRLRLSGLRERGLFPGAAARHARPARDGGRVPRNAPQLQGSRSFPGLHKGMEDAIFHGARVKRTVRLHGLSLRARPSDRVVDAWASTTSIRATRPWLLHAWPHMEKAIAWIRLTA